MEGAGYVQVDSFIYPIAFNMRHGVELWLKLFTMRLERINALKPAEGINLGSTHDLNVLWDHFKCNALLKDFRFQDPIEKLNDYINDIGEIDPTAQTFRYPYSKESVKHLVSTPLINIGVLFNRLVELKKNLDKLDELSRYLIEEYRMGSYTKKLNRVQLFELADYLPEYSEWRKPEFKKLKIKAREKFGLSSNDLTKAIDLIKTHYEFSAKIGISIPLKQASQADVEFYLSAWGKYHAGYNPMNLATEENIRNQLEAVVDVVSNLSTEVIADMIALGELRAFCSFSEKYHDVYDQELKSAEAEKYNDELFRSHVRHYLRKTTLPRNILSALSILQQKDMINKLEAKFECIKELTFEKKSKPNLESEGTAE